MPPLKILFMGSPEMALPSLEGLLQSEDQVVGVVSQPNRPAGRGRELTPPPIAILAREKKIPLFQPEKIKNNSEFLKEIKDLSPDLMVIVAYGKILPKELLDLPPHQSINVHFSGLIGWRRDWFWSQAASRSLARDLTCEASPACSTRSRSSAMVLKPERSPNGLVPGSDFGVWAGGCGVGAWVGGCGF